VKHPYVTADLRRIHHHLRSASEPIRRAYHRSCPRCGVTTCWESDPKETRYLSANVVDGDTGQIRYAEWFTAPSLHGRTELSVWLQRHRHCS